MRTTLPLEIISIEDDGYHVITKGKINGKEARLLIDTGASRTVFDIEKIVTFPDISPDNFNLMDKRSSGLGTNSMESFTIILNKFSLGKLKLKEYESVLISMTHVNQSYEMLNLPPIDGVIGGDILSKYKAILDYGKKELILESNS
jgi:hypothetical protein